MPAVKIPDLNVVDIDTHEDVKQVDPGMAGVAILMPGDKEGLQTYNATMEVANNYDSDSYVYKFANNYFNAPGSTTLQVITYDQSASSNTSNNSDPYNFAGFRSAITSNENKTTSAAMFNSIKDNFSSLFGTNDNTINEGLNFIQSQFATGHPQKVNDALADIHGELQTIAQSRTTTDPAVSALIKYYGCGAEYFVFLVDKDNEKTAIDLSNEFEGQAEHNLFLDIPTSNSQPDFSWLAPIKSNLDTTFLSLPFSGDLSDYQFVSDVLAQRAPENPAANLQFIHNLPDVAPQDKYNFTSGDLDKYYKPYGVITYCYRNGIPMLTSGNSADGYQMSNVVVRDYLNVQVSDGVTKLLVGAHDAGSDIHYDQAGINQIQAEIRMILSDAKSRGYIANFNMKNVDADTISEATKESGYLSGLGYTWIPNNNINHIEFQQGIVLPKL